MNKEDLKRFLTKKPSYLKKGKGYLSTMFNLPEQECKEALKEVKLELKRNFPKAIKPKLGPLRKLPKPYHGNPDNILVIGDLHEPFCLNGYLEFVREIQEKEDCGKIIFIGDIIDNHYSSYHETDPDGFSAGEELDRAISKISNWYKVFPKATVIIGNHDRMAYRKAQSAGVSKQWVRKYNEVLNTPNWEFKEYVEINGVNYNHGEGGTAKNKMKNEIQSQVQGHLHSQFYIDYAVGPKDRIFAVQVGCGIDREAYAMAYGKNFKKPIIGCATIINNIPKIYPMSL